MYSWQLRARCTCCTSSVPIRAARGITSDSRATWRSGLRVTAMAPHARPRNWPSIEGSDSLSLGPGRARRSLSTGSRGLVWSTAARSAARPRLCPVQPDRCQWFAVGGRSLGGAGLAPRRRDRRERPRRRSSTAIRSPAPLDGPAALARNAWCRLPRNGEQPPANGERGQPPGVGVAPVRAPAREGAALPTPGAPTDPRPLTAETVAQMVMLLAVSAPSQLGIPRDRTAANSAAGGATSARRPPVLQPRLSVDRPQGLSKCLLAAAAG